MSLRLVYSGLQKYSTSLKVIIIFYISKDLYTFFLFSFFFFLSSYDVSNESGGLFENCPEAPSQLPINSAKKNEDSLVKNH